MRTSAFGSSDRTHLISAIDATGINGSTRELSSHRGRELLTWVIAVPRQNMRHWFNTRKRPMSERGRLEG